MNRGQGLLLVVLRCQADRPVTAEQQEDLLIRLGRLDVDQPIRLRISPAFPSKD